MPINPYHAGFNPKLSVGTAPIMMKRPAGLKVPKRPKKRFSWKRTRKQMQKRPGFGMVRTDYVESLKRALGEANIPLDEWNELNSTEKEQVLEELVRTLPSMRRSSGMAKMRKKGVKDPAHVAMLLFKKAGVLSQYRTLHEGDEPTYTYGTKALKAEIEEEKKKKKEEAREAIRQSAEEVLEEHRVQTDPYQSYDYKP